MKKKSIKHLSQWEWSTLVASWRYYEYRMTIASAMFPADIIERFWKSERYDDNVLHTIANQFSKVDHYRSGEEDWIKTWGDVLHDSDKEPWCKFYAFCKAWCDGFTTLTIDNGKQREDRECFYCEFTKHWHPKKEYIDHPLNNFFVPNEYIKKSSK